MMSLQEAIAEMMSLGEEADWLPQDVALDREVDVIDHAIATILNAVVKGELKHDDDR